MLSGSGRSGAGSGGSNKTWYIIGGAALLFVAFISLSGRTTHVPAGAGGIAGGGATQAKDQQTKAVTAAASRPRCAVNMLPQRAPDLAPSPFAFDPLAFASDPTPLSVGLISAEACPSYRMSVPIATTGWTVVTGEGTLSGGPDPHKFIQQYTPFVEHLKAHDVVLDIGANIGLSMLPMAARGLVVVGFEPVHKNVVKLKQSVIVNGMVNAAVVHAAVGNPKRAGEKATIYAPTNGEDNTSLHPAVANANVKGAPVREEVDLIGIDMWLEANAKYIDADAVRFVKIDVQGFEYGVVRGMEKVLRSNGPRGLVVQAEFTPRLIRLGGGNPRDLLDFMHACGYSGRPTWVTVDEVLGGGVGSTIHRQLTPADFEKFAANEALDDDLVFTYTAQRN